LLSAGSAGSPAPQIDRQVSSEGHDQASSGSLTDSGFAELLERRRVVGLPAQKAPGHFNEGVTYHRVATPIDTAFSTMAVAVVNARTQAGVAGNLAPIVETVPTSKLKG